MMMQALIFLAFTAGCKKDKLSESCPPHSSGTDACVCDEGFYGSIEWAPSTHSYQGECISGLDMALESGDPAYVSDPNDIIDEAILSLQEVLETEEQLLKAIYGSDPVVYNPTEWSHLLMSQDLENNFNLIQGSEVGHTLAIAGQQSDSRYAAFGSNVVFNLINGGSESFELPFERLLNWMIEGQASDVLPQDVQVAVTAIGWDQGSVSDWFTNQYGWSVLECNNITELSICASNVELLVVGAQAPNEDTEQVQSVIRDALSSGTAILFLHTETWADSAQGAGVLEELHMTYGGYGGNFWAADQASWDRVEDMIAGGGIAGSLINTLGHFQNEDFDFDWSYCTDWVGQIFCDEVPGLRSEFYTGAENIKYSLNALDQQGIRLFENEANRVWKLMALLGDLYRREIVYPMSKSDSDIMPFMRALFADHAVHYSRTFNPAQIDLGSFSEDIPFDLADEASRSAFIEGSKYGGFTAIGYSAVPGEVFTIERIDGADVSAYVFINTQRTGSTREYNDNSYDRPKFLQSPMIELLAGEELSLSSPYGGLLQLYVAQSSSDPVLELNLSGVGQHPVLYQNEDPNGYLEELQNSFFPFTEILNPYVQIHSRSEMMVASIESYGGDLDSFFYDLDHYMIEDTYNLAGFQGDNLALNDAVWSFCQLNEWDCEDFDTHGKPALQHINVDVYAQCGAGCSGNPYDQSWALGPLGWGESHEIGHNLQRQRLDIYGGRSSEVSNQIFPLHKHTSYYLDTEIALSQDNVADKSTFDILQASILEDDPFDYAYQQIWASEGIYDNNSQRMAFYMQVVHRNADLDYLESGWDVYTLMYLHERIFNTALDNWSTDTASRIGFETYSAPPSEISGNDFMLISMSFVTHQDQRPFFNMWGIEFSEDASSQIDQFDFVETPMWYYPSENANAESTAEPIAVDGFGVWPY